MKRNRNYVEGQRKTSVKGVHDDYPVFFAKEESGIMDYNGILSGKQHLNVSQKAFAILSDDMLSFQMASYSNYVNLIFNHYYELADSSISRTLDRIRQYEEEMVLSGQCSEENMDSMIEREANRLLLKAKSYPKGVARKIYLNKENTEILESEFALESRWYGGHPMRYFKCVIEEYAEKNRLERESILFRDRIELINRSQEQHQLLCLETGKRTFEVKPFQVIPDYNSMHYYLVGISRELNVNASEDKIASFRVSRLTKIKTRPKSYRSGRLTNLEQRQVVERIEKDGVQFLIEPCVTVKLRLTTRGLERYHNQAHLRPKRDQEIECDDGYILTFHCTELQIRYYFFPFGPDVEILEPASLREFFKARYKAAYALYEDSN